jgi:hypothetical protein
MRLHLIVLLVVLVASLGCSDDDADDRDGGTSDAGRDAAPDDGDADVPAIDARVVDGSDEDASDEDASDPSDGGDGGVCLEASYLWAVEECFGGSPGYNARRVTLAEFCADYDCPADWNAALAAASDCNEDAGSELCWTASTECGADLLRSHRGPDGRFLYYDAAGRLIGAAAQLTDAVEECVASELIAGERPPICCEDTEP